MMFVRRPQVRLAHERTHVLTEPTQAIEDVDRRYVFHQFMAPRRHEADGALVIVRGERQVDETVEPVRQGVDEVAAEHRAG